MGEYIESPHPPSKGMSADGAKYLQAVSIAQQTGKSVEEVLQFMGITAPVQIKEEPKPKDEKFEAAMKAVVETAVQLGMDVPLDVKSPIKEVAKAIAKEIVTPKAQDDGFIVTEEVSLENASEADLSKLAQQEADEEQDWSGKIRVGSKVRITWHRDQGAKGRLQWVGKVGKVVTATSKDGVTIYLVEFTGRKIPRLKLDKKSGKLLKGYELKPFQLIVDDSQVELA